jgi:beta-carotene 3-hydroxylase
VHGLCTSAFGSKPIEITVGPTGQPALRETPEHRSRFGQVVLPPSHTDPLPTTPGVGTDRTGTIEEVTPRAPRRRPAGHEARSDPERAHPGDGDAGRHVQDHPVSFAAERVHAVDVTSARHGTGMARHGIGVASTRREALASVTTVVRFAALVAVGFVVMEPVTYATHRWVMHGRGWGWHRSHHEAAGRRLERNDRYPIVFASIVGLGLAIGFNVAGWGALVPLGAGVTAYGVAYAVVHDGCIHGRLPVPAALRRSVRRLDDAHRLHHRFGGEPFGMLAPVVPASLRERIATAPRADRTDGHEPGEELLAVPPFRAGRPDRGDVVGPGRGEAPRIVQ